MIHRLESQIFKSKSQLEQIDKELASGKIALEEYKFQKADIQKQISEYQSKLEDKADKLHTKEQELNKLTQDLSETTKLILIHLVFRGNILCLLRTNGLRNRIRK